MKKVLVIVVTFNGMRWLQRCLDSVCGRAPQADVLVVDNDSTDGSADFVHSHFPAVKLIRCADNLGFTGGNNLGFDWALRKGYDYIYLLNQDAWLEEGALDKLLAVADTHPAYAVLSPLQMTDGYRAYDRQFQKRLPKGSGEVLDVPFVMAAHWLMRADALRQVGSFCTLFPYYGQDDNWCQRARYRGWKIGIVPAARAVHDRAQRQEAKEKVIRRNYYVGSLVRLCDPNRPLWERFLFVCLFTLVKTVKYGSFLPLKYFVQLCRELPAVRKQRKASC